MIKFYRSAAIDFDIDTALETLIFVSTHFIINTQFYCSLWNASILRRMSASLIQGMDQGLKEKNCISPHDLPPYDWRKKLTVNFQLKQIIELYALKNCSSYLSIWTKFTIKICFRFILARTCEAAKYYTKMDQIYFFIRKWFGILLFISTQTIVLPPIVICLNGLRSSDTMTNEMCSLPIKISYVQTRNCPLKPLMVDFFAIY